MKDDHVPTTALETYRSEKYTYIIINYYNLKKVLLLSLLIPEDEFCDTHTNLTVKPLWSYFNCIKSYIHKLDLKY